MNPPSASHLGELLRTLVLADDRESALRAWLSAAEPDADLVVLAPRPGDAAAAAMRRSGSSWSPIALPPVELPSAAGVTSRRAVAERRENEFDDLLSSLGMTGLLVVPLAGAGRDTLFIARAREPFGDDDERSVAESAGWLAAALASQARAERRERRERHAAREVAALLDLSRELGSPLGARPAAAGAARALQQMLDAPVGGVFVRTAPEDRGLAAVWPDGPTGHAVAERLSQAVGAGSAAEIVPSGSNARLAPGPASLRWLSSSPGEASNSYPRVLVALGFDGDVPEAAARVIEAVEALLRLALDRIYAHRQQEERRVSDTVEALPLGVALMSPGGQLRFVNTAGRTLLESVGAWRGNGTQLERLGNLELRGLTRQAARDGGASAEILFPAQNRIVELRVVPSGGQPERGDAAARDALLLLEDVTESRRRTRQLAQAEKLSALGVLISGIVHEINNPLATILGYAQMLSRNPEAEGRARWLELVADEAQRCQRIVSNMLTLAREREPRQRVVSPDAVAERALSLLAYPLRVGGVEVTLRASPEAPDVEGDADAMLQVFINLLTNAMHALEERDDPKSILVEIGRAADGSAEIVIEDNGPGVSPEARSKLFDPFFTTKPEGKGTGLGLSLVDSTIRRHGGEIELASAPGRGARFTITLPAAESPPPAERAACAVKSELTGLDGCRVLVADDEPAVAGLLREVLERSGASVHLAADGREALEKIVAESPDVIVADLRMPGLGGERLVAELRARRPELAERIVFSTGEPRGSGDEPVVTLAGRPCLVKPFDLPTLISTVRGVHARALPDDSSGGGAAQTGDRA